MTKTEHRFANEGATWRAEVSAIMTIRFAVAHLTSSLAIAAIIPCVWIATGCNNNDTPKTDTTSTTSTQSQTTPAASGATTPPPMGSGGAMMGGGRDKMMQAGIDACTGKAASDACTVADGAHTMTGKCTAPPAGAPDTKLSCRPDGAGPGGDHGGHGDHAPPTKP